MAPIPPPAEPQLICTHCSHRFDSPEGNRARCPECLKKSGVVAVGTVGDDEAEDAPATPRTRGWLIAIGLLALAAIAGWWWLGHRHHRVHLDDVGTTGDPISKARTAAAKGGLPEGVPICFEVGAAVRGLAGDLQISNVQSLAEALDAAARAGRFTRESYGNVDMAAPPRPAEAVAEAIREGSSPMVSPYELGCLAYALAIAQEFEVDPAVSLTAKNSGTAVRRKSFGLLDVERFYDVGAGVADALTQARDLSPEAFVAYGLAMRAAFHLQQGAHGDAAEAIHQAMKLYDAEPAFLALSGQIKVASGMPEFGIEDIAKAVNQKPDALGWFNLGMAWAQAQSPFKAFQALRKATELDTNFPDAWLGLANLEMQRLELVPSDQIDAKLKEIGEYFDKAKAIDANFEGLRVSQAQLALLQDKRDDAKTLLKEEIEIRPQSADPRLMLGQVALMEESPAQAVEHLEIAAMALAAKPTGAQARQLLTAAYAGIEDWARAEAFSRKLVEAAPDAPDTRLMLAGALKEAGKLTDAAKVLEEQFTRFPKEPAAPLLLAQLALDDGKPEVALEKARASRAAKDTFEGLVVEALALFRTGRADAAVQVVHEEAKRRANAHMLAAQALLEQGEVPLATTLLEAGIQTEPTNVDVAVMLYMTHLATGQVEKAEAVRSAALDRAPADQTSDWRQKFEEGKRQVDTLGQKPSAEDE